MIWRGGGLPDIRKSDCRVMLYIPCQLDVGFHIIMSIKDYILIDRKKFLLASKN